VVEIHDRVVGPERPLDFLSGYDLAPTLDKHSQDLQRLLPKKDYLLIAVRRPDQAQFTGSQINFKFPEPDANCLSLCHGRYDIAASRKA